MADITRLALITDAGSPIVWYAEVINTDDGDQVCYRTVAVSKSLAMADIEAFLQDYDLVGNEHAVTRCYQLNFIY